MSIRHKSKAKKEGELAKPTDSESDLEKRRQSLLAIISAQTGKPPSQLTGDDVAEYIAAELHGGAATDERIQRLSFHPTHRRRVSTNPRHL